MFDSPIDVSLFGSTGTGTEQNAFIVGGLEGERILAPIVDPAAPVLTDQIKVATTVAKTAGASLQVTLPATMPEQTPMEYREEMTPDTERELLRWALDESETVTPNVEGAFLYTRRVVNGILQFISSHEIDTLVVPSTSGDGLFGRSITDSLVAQAECDAIVVNGQPGYDEIPSLLLPIAGGPHSGLAADLAQRIAEASDAWIDILHVIEEDATEQETALAEEYVRAADNRIGRPASTTTWVLEAEDAAEAIVEQSRYYGLTVIGAPTIGRLHRFVYGSTNRAIRAEAESVVLSVRNHGDAEQLLDS